MTSKQQTARIKLIGDAGVGKLSLYKRAAGIDDTPPPVPAGLSTPLTPTVNEQTNNFAPPPPRPNTLSARAFGNPANLHSHNPDRKQAEAFLAMGLDEFGSRTAESVMVAPPLALGARTAAIDPPFIPQARTMWVPPDTREPDIVVVCFDIGNPKTLQNVEEKWLKECKKSYPQATPILMGMKSDLREEFDRSKLIPQRQAIQLARHLNLYYIEYSSKSQTVQRVFDPCDENEVELPEESNLGARVGRVFDRVAGLVLDRVAPLNKPSKKAQDHVEHLEYLLSPASDVVDPESGQRQQQKDERFASVFDNGSSKQSKDLFDVTYTMY